MVVGVVGVGVVGFGAVRGAPSTAAAVPTAENDAINWITANLGPKASVLAPATVGQGLGNAHFDTSRVVTYDGGSATVPDWHCCNVLLAAAARGQQDVQDALPPQLQAAYDSSRPMATFDEGGTTVELRQVLNGTPAEVATGIETEHTELVTAGKDIIASKRIELSPAAKAELTAGEVDSRVILALAAIAQRHLVSVADFPNDAAGTAGRRGRAAGGDRRAGRKGVGGRQRGGDRHDEHLQRRGRPVPPDVAGADRRPGRRDLARHGHDLRRARSAGAGHQCGRK